MRNPCYICDKAYKDCQEDCVPYLQYRIHIKNSKSETKKKRYNKFKNEGKCVYCGKDTNGKNVYCEECREKKRAERLQIFEFRKSLGLCPVCGKNEVAYDEGSCPDCRYKNAIYRKNNKDKIRSTAKKVYKTRISKGLCHVCGKAEADEGYVTCSTCREKQRKNKKKYRDRKDIGKIKREEWASYGLCARCGKNELMDGKKICEECYNKLSSNKDNIKPSKSHPWNKYFPRRRKRGDSVEKQGV